MSDKFKPPRKRYGLPASKLYYEHPMKQERKRRDTTWWQGLVLGFLFGWAFAVVFLLVVEAFTRPMGVV